MERFKIGSVVKVIQFLPTSGDYCSLEEVKRTEIMPRLRGHNVCIVDISDAHGLAYRIVKLNYDGSYGREDEVSCCWVEPNEIEAL